MKQKYETQGQLEVGTMETISRIRQYALEEKTLRVCTHVCEQYQICECDFLALVNFCRSVHMHPDAICVMRRLICVCDIFGQETKILHLDANLR